MIAPKHSVHLLTKRLYILGLHSALLLFQVINHGDHASLREKPFSTLQPYPTNTHTHQHGYCCSRATAFLPSHILPRFASLLSRQLGFAPEAGKSDRHGVPLPPPGRGGGQGRTGPRSRLPHLGGTPPRTARRMSAAACSLTFCPRIDRPWRSLLGTLRRVAQRHIHQRDGLCISGRKFGQSISASDFCSAHRRACQPTHEQRKARRPYMTPSRVSQLQDLKPTGV
jgi:hypothetical protein